MIYLISDTHFCHNKPFIYEARGFNNIEEMNLCIIKNWNEIISNEDDVYLLGDVMLNDMDKGLECLKQLKGKIHIIRGNHDSDARLELYKTCKNVIEVCDAKFLKYKKKSFFLSHYPCMTGNYDDTKVINVSGHTHYKTAGIKTDTFTIYNVACDANDCTPVSIDTILEFFKKEA